VQNAETLAYKLKMMGHPIRLQILQMLRHGETCVCHLEHAIGRRQAYVSQQLMVLRDADLVAARKDGLQVYYRLADAEVVKLLDVLYGESESPLEILSDCPCPTCSNILEINLVK
jgi:DNA-binding transcriptional ArsR family regulator